MKEEEGDAQYHAASFLRLDLLTGFNANGVKLQSPASRCAVRSIAKHGSTRWVNDHLFDRTPTGLH